jgi:hypothetical protein
MESGAIKGNGDKGVIVPGGGTCIKKDGSAGVLGGGTFTMNSPELRAYPVTSTVTSAQVLPTMCTTTAAR